MVQLKLFVLFGVGLVVNIRVHAERNRNATHGLTVLKLLRDPVRASALYSLLQHVL